MSVSSLRASGHPPDATQWGWGAWEHGRGGR